MKIRKTLLALTLALVFFTSCSNNDDSTPVVTINGLWHVENISGGFAGIDDDYQNGEITWTFTNQTLTVDNNAPQSALYSGLDTGTYAYSTSEIDGVTYINIDTMEFGGYSLSSTGLIIDQNIISTGSGADGFILTFKR